MKKKSVHRVVTGDGSHSLFVPELNEHYHSTFGAIQESEFIFIESGIHYFNQLLSSAIWHLASCICHPASAILHPASGILHPASGIPHPPPPITILEIGFGTGLNALLTQIEAERTGQKISYTSLEAYPLDCDIWSRLNYPHRLGAWVIGVFEQLHEVPWNKPEVISPMFTLHKINGNLETFRPGKDEFNIIFFDAFGPDVQPELWTPGIFKSLFLSLKKEGILVTYSVKGTVVKALQSAGFYTEKLPGPPGKRHILRALKNNPPQK